MACECPVSCSDVFMQRTLNKRIGVDKHIFIYNIKHLYSDLHSVFKISVSVFSGNLTNELCDANTIHKLHDRRRYVDF